MLFTDTGALSPVLLSARRCPKRLRLPAVGSAASVFPWYFTSQGISFAHHTRTVPVQASLPRNAQRPVHRYDHAGAADKSPGRSPGPCACQRSTIYETRRFPAAFLRQRTGSVRQEMRLPGFISPSGAMSRSLVSSSTDRIIPRDSRPRMVRGARLATTQTCLPTSSSGLKCAAIPDRI